jgi:hypothetical protein
MQSKGVIIPTIVFKGSGWCKVLCKVYPVAVCAIVGMIIIG